MNSLFAKKPTIKEQAKVVKKEVKSGQRDLDREVRDLDKREVTLVAEIKKEAKLNRSEKTIKILAKQLVGLRNQRTRILGARAHVGAMANQASAMAANAAVADVAKTAGKMMGKMNKAYDPAKVGLSMQEFQRETEKMNMTEEVMDDMLSSAFDSEDAEDDADAVVEQVLAEIGVDLTAGLVEAPSAKPNAEQKQADEHEEKLAAQLSAL